MQSSAPQRSGNINARRDAAPSGALRTESILFRRLAKVEIARRMYRIDCWFHRTPHLSIQTNPRITAKHFDVVCYHHSDERNRRRDSGRHPKVWATLDSSCERFSHDLHTQAGNGAGPFAWAWAIPLDEDHGAERRLPARAENQRIRSIFGFFWAGTREERLSVVLCIGVAIGLGLLPPFSIDKSSTRPYLRRFRIFVEYCCAPFRLECIANGSDMGSEFCNDSASKSIDRIVAVCNLVQSFSTPVSYSKNQMSGAVAHQCTVVSELGNRLSTAFIQGGVASIVAACSVVVAAWISLKLFLAVVPIVILESAIHGWILYQSRHASNTFGVASYRVRW